MARGWVGSMSRRGNPYDKAKAESFMKMQTVEAVYLAAHETFEDMAADLPRFINEASTKGAYVSSREYRSPAQCWDQHAR